tara:strand:- start:15110 stop:16735 length:1626 start_codon:yes stop_codon:yes gene_type:complete
MTTVPLGVAAYDRQYGQEPEIQLLNRFFEQTPTNQVEQFDLLARPGSIHFLTKGSGPMRKTIHQEGVFNDDLFFVSGAELYRYDGTTTTLITGVVGGSGTPDITFVGGPGYEHLFMADGLTLQYYDGISAATGTLTVSGAGITALDTVQIDTVFYEYVVTDVNAGTQLGTVGAPFLVSMGQVHAVNTLTRDGGHIADADVVLIDTTYYSWTATDVNAGTPAGTVGSPWLIDMGTTDLDCLLNLQRAIMSTGENGIDYSLGTPSHTTVTASDASSTSIKVTAITQGTGGNSIVTTETGTYISWPSATLEGGAADDEQALLNLFNCLNASGIAGQDYSAQSSAHTTVLGAGSAATTLTVRYRTRGTIGNTVDTLETGSDLAWADITLVGGGVHKLNGVITPDDVAMVALTTIASFVVVVQASSQRFYWIQPGSLDIDALDFAEAESEPDELISVKRVGDALWFFGQSSTEVWYVSGAQDAPFSRQQGLAFSQGVIAGTPVPVRTQVVLIAEDLKVYQTVGGPVRLSQHGIEERIRLSEAAAIA